jgi:hypothetical protein
MLPACIALVAEEESASLLSCRGFLAERADLD